MKEENFTIWFNPWRYQSSEQIWSGLGHAIISQTINRLKPVNREKFLFKLWLKRIDRAQILQDLRSVIYTKGIALVAAIIICAVFAILPLLGTIFEFPSWINIPSLTLSGGGFLAIIIDLFYSRYKNLSKKLSGTFTKYVRVPDYQSQLGIFHEIIEDLRGYLRSL